MAEYKLYQLDEIQGLEEFIEQHQFVFSITNDGETILSNTIFHDLIFNIYPTRKLCYREGADDSKLVLLFSQLWSSYKSMNMDNIVKKWEVLQQEYDPLENYNGTEETDRTLTQKGDSSLKTGSLVNTSIGDSKTISGEIKETETPHNRTSTTEVAGYNSDAWNNQTKVTDSGSTDDSRTFNNYKEGVNLTDTQTYNSIKDSVDMTDTEHVTLIKHGNLGVTSSQNMLRQELEVRSYNLMYEIVKDFINYCTVF